MPFRVSVSGGQGRLRSLDRERGLGRFGSPASDPALTQTLRSDGHIPDKRQVIATLPVARLSGGKPEESRDETQREIVQ
jgi:hypothetical protein